MLLQHLFVRFCTFILLTALHTYRPLYSKIIKVTNAVAKLGLPVLAQQESFGVSHFPVGGSIGLVFLTFTSYKNQLLTLCSILWYRTYFHGQTKFESGSRVASALLFCEV